MWNDLPVGIYIIESNWNYCTNKPDEKMLDLKQATLYLEIQDSEQSACIFYQYLYQLGGLLSSQSGLIHLE